MWTQQAVATTLGVALGLAPGLHAEEVAFTTTNTSLPGSAFDTLQVAGGPVSLPVSPDELEFPFDVDYSQQRLFVLGYGQDDGSSPPTRALNDQDRSTLWSLNLDGSDPQLLATGLDRAPFLDVAPDGATIYFSQEGTGSDTGFQNDGRISRLTVGTGDVETIVIAPAGGGATGVDFDPTSGFVYYGVLNRGPAANIALQQIRRVAAATTDGVPGSDSVFLANPTPPDGVLDTADEFTVVSATRNVQVHEGWVYWTWRNSSFAPASEIRRLPVDFDIGTDDPTAFETVVQGDFIVDFEVVGDEIVWTDASFNSVFRAGIDGTDQTTVGSGLGFNSLPIGVAVITDFDFVTLVGCLSGPDIAVAADCDAQDLDNDTDVDLHDFAQFQVGSAL